MIMIMIGSDRQIMFLIMILNMILRFRWFTLQFRDGTTTLLMAPSWYFHVLLVGNIGNGCWAAAYSRRAAAG